MGRIQFLLPNVHWKFLIERDCSPTYLSVSSSVRTSSSRESGKRNPENFVKLQR